MSYPRATVPALPASEDAWNRAVRTFVQGLLVDVGAVVVAVLVTALGSPEWTAEYWMGIGVLLLKTVVTAVASYAARKLAPPPTG
jgi:hypothetical protein